VQAPIFASYLFAPRGGARYPWTMRKSTGRLLAFAFRNLRPSAAAVAFAWMMLVIPQAEGATFTVNSLDATPDASPGDGICDDGTGHCTLAAAAAESSRCGDVTIVLAARGTITAGANFVDATTSGSSTCSGTLTIIGPGSEQLTINGDLVFTNGLGTPISLISVSGLTIVGAITATEVSGALTLNDMVTSGGGVSVNSATLAGIEVVVVNSHIEGSNGAGLSATGPFASILLTDSAVSYSGKAGVGVAGSVSILRSRIDSSRGPGVQVLPSRGSGDISIVDGTISNNAGDGVDAGSNVGGTLRLLRSAIERNGGAGIVNTADRAGFAVGLSATVADSTIADNAGPGFRTNSDTSITRSTISGNTGGGINVAACDGDGPLTVTETTISGNSTPGSGGGILFVAFGSMELDHDTIVNNHADSDGDGVGAGGGVSAATCGNQGGGSITHSLLTGNSDGAGALDCAVTQSYVGASLPVVTVDSNIIDSAAGGCSIGAHNHIAISPKIAPLVDNGGLTQTHALLAGSPAIDAAGPCSGTDQRGVTRPQGMACDIGAFEFACGNGLVDLGEQCDGGAGGDGDCCSADCRFYAPGSSCGDDGEPCTADVCNDGGSCTHAFPLTLGCHLPDPRGATLTINESPSDRSDSVAWKWKGLTGLDDFGSPTTGSSITLCVADAVGNLKLSATMPAAGICAGKNCWRATKSGYSYADPELTPSGIRSATLRGSASGSGTIKIKGNGENLAAGELPFALPAMVRLVRSDAPVCWESRLTTATRNQVSAFRAKAE
jgi:hypothetical protein